MISRRNIRVKVMQTLYALYSLTEKQDLDTIVKTGEKILQDKLDRSINLFIISLLYTTQVAQYVEKEAGRRAGKYLPNTADLNVNTKIAGNTFLWEILENKSFSEKVAAAKLNQWIDEGWIKKLYLQLSTDPIYLTYFNTAERDSASEKDIIKYIWEKLIYENESLNEYFTDEFTDWEDDKEMTKMWMDNFFKFNSKKINFLQPVSYEKKTYSQDILKAVIEKETTIMPLIEPKLNNWEVDRVALIDILLLKMGVAEFLFFPTIPTKVTINEHIELAKMYSTPQSGHFVNGVLDNILKDLIKEGTVNKPEIYKKK